LLIPGLSIRKIDVVASVHSSDYVLSRAFYYLFDYAEFPPAAGDQYKIIFSTTACGSGWKNYLILIPSNILYALITNGISAEQIVLWLAEQEGRSKVW